MKPIILIPARMASIRLPNKPLADINGLPMIVHVVNRAKEAGIGRVVVACAENEIKQAVEENGGEAILTNPDLPSGTDRIFEALRKCDPDGEHDVIINVQGDLPTIDPKIIKDCLIPFENDAVDMTSLVAKITDEAERNNPNVVKAVVAWGKNSPRIGKALYFTRTTAPYGEGDLYHHIGLYGFRRAAIEKFTSLPPSALEMREKLEQLRALENNMRIDVVEVDIVPLGVDAMEDLQKAREVLK